MLQSSDKFTIYKGKIILTPKFHFSLWKIDIEEWNERYVMLLKNIKEKWEEKWMKMKLNMWMNILKPSKIWNLYSLLFPSKWNTTNWIRSTTINQWERNKQDATTGKSNELTNENRILKSNEVRFMRKVEEENKLDIFFKSTNIY